MPESWTTDRATIAGLARRGVPDSDPRWDEARRNLKARKIDKFIREVVDSAPPPRPADLERLRALLPAPAATTLEGGAPDAA